MEQHSFQAEHRGVNQYAPVVWITLLAKGFPE
jgi:hypothetical protein